jgi:50S ribosomal subunit-associated GTPase HflX
LVYNKIDINPDFVVPTFDTATSFLVSASQKVGIAALQTELIARSQRSSGKNTQKS